MPSGRRKGGLARKPDLLEEGGVTPQIDSRGGSHAAGKKEGWSGAEA
jgi:hypothetical protein